MVELEALVNETIQSLDSAVRLAWRRARAPVPPIAGIAKPTIGPLNMATLRAQESAASSEFQLVARLTSCSNREGADQGHPHNRRDTLR